MCEAIQNGSRVIFGPFDRAAADHVQSIGRGLQIPVLQAHWDPRDLMTNSFSRDRIPAHVNLYPSVGNLSQGYREIISHFRWKNLTLLYEDEDGERRLVDLIELPFTALCELIMNYWLIVYSVYAAPAIFQPYNGSYKFQNK